METNKRYQVFVSSTYLDLREARAGVVSALLNLDAIPAGMELFPAADDDAWTLIEDVIADSDYYLLIIAGKYGSIDPTTGLSFTEREFDTAVRLNKPVMAFIHGSPGKLLAEQTESSDEGRAKLEAFREKVQSSKHVKFWESPKELEAEVALTWNSFRRRYPATGWVKADQATSKESLAALAKAQAEIESLKDQLETVRTQAPPGTENMAQGMEKFSLPVRILSNRSAYRKQISGWIEIEMTWDRAFGYLGLRMMQEANETTLKKDLQNVVVNDNLPSLRSEFDDLVMSTSEEHDIEVNFYKLSNVTISDEDFQNIRLQFNALGLIQHSQRGRSVKDTANYWTLTPYGNTHLVKMRALKTNEKSLKRSNSLSKQIPSDE